jgi:hypothetical protein
LQTFLDLKELKHEDGRAHTVLIAAPTHAEIQEVTSRLRGALQERGIISAAEKKLERLDSLDLAEAQKRDELTYRPGLVIEPHFNITGAKKSEQLQVVSAANGTVKVRDRQGNARELRLEESEKWGLYERQTIGLAVGDQVRVTKNQLVATNQAGEDGKAVRKRLTNGDVLRVQKIDGDRIHLERDGKAEGVLDASKGLHLTYGYVITSNAAQGKPGLSGQSRNPDIILWDRRASLSKLGRDLPVKNGGLLVRSQQDHGIQKLLDPGETRFCFPPLGALNHRQKTDLKDLRTMSSFKRYCAVDYSFRPSSYWAPSSALSPSPSTKGCVHPSVAREPTVR